MFVVHVLTLLGDWRKLEFDTLEDDLLEKEARRDNCQKVIVTDRNYIRLA